MGSVSREGLRKNSTDRDVNTIQESWGRCIRKHFGKRCTFIGVLGDELCVNHYDYKYGSESFEGRHTQS